jgi:hypothetical protein
MLRDNHLHGEPEYFLYIYSKGASYSYSSYGDYHLNKAMARDTEKGKLPSIRVEEGS